MGVATIDDDGAAASVTLAMETTLLNVWERNADEGNAGLGVVEPAIDVTNSSLIVSRAISFVAES